MTDWTIIFRSLTGRLFSTITTVLTVAVAVALMLVLITMREAGKRAFERGAGDMHLYVSAEASPLASILNGIFYANPPRRSIPASRYEKLKTQAPWAYAVPIQQGDSYLGMPVIATTPEFFSKYLPNLNEPWTLADGRFFTGDFEVVVGAQAAQVSGLKVGDEIFLTHGIGLSRQARAAAEQSGETIGEAHVHYDFSYRVVGILKPTGGSHDRALMTSLQSTWIIHAHDRRLKDTPGIKTTTAADLIESDRKITGIYLRLVTREGGSGTPANLPQVFTMLRADPTITVAAPFDEIRKLDVIVGNVNTIFIAIAAAVMLSSGIAIMLALYNSMDLRRRQIAVLRVLGASQPRIFGLVITESALIGIFGALAGIVLALVGSLAAASLMKEYIGLAISPIVPLRELIIVTLATIALACIAGLIPAVSAYRTAVATNLRPIG